MAQFTLRILAAPFAGLAWLLERALSRRGLAVSILVLMGVLSWGPWLRPPLSRDFRGTHLSWGIVHGSSVDPIGGREIPRLRPFLGIGSILLIALAGSGAAILVWPRLAGWIYAGQLVLVMAAVAACLFNHPALIEYLDAESEQRAELSRLFSANHDDLLTGRSPDRTAELRDPRNRPKNFGYREGQTLAGWRYQMSGPWLFGVTLLAMIIHVKGSWRQRMMLTITVLMIGVAVSTVVCWRRLQAERYLAQAYALERDNEHRQALDACEDAVRVFPDFANTRRYWLQTGRLAFRLGQQNDRELLFRAHQLLRSRNLDAAEGLMAPWLNNNLNDDANFLVRDLMAEILGAQALSAISADRPSAAETKWRTAHELAPWRTVGWVGIGFAMTMVSPQQAAQAEEILMPRLEQIGDRLVRSDVTSMVGDAYFRDGDFSRARELYERSMKTFSLPKYANIHAQEGVLGL